MKKKLIKFLLNFVLSKAQRKKLRDKYILELEEEIDETALSELELYEYNRKRYNIGEYSYIGVTSVIKNKEETTIGKFCQIAQGVRIGMSQSPIYTLSTHPFVQCKELNNHYGGKIVASAKTRIKWEKEDLKPPIHIGNDVWIGLNAIIKDGINIGDGAIVAAGAVVTHDVPPYAIVGGVPAKIIRYRFSEEIINKLLELQWWDYPADFLCNQLPFDDIEKC